MSHPAVVRIYATTQEPDYDCPWQSLTPHNSTGSGVLIDAGRVLTGAHVVADATFIQVQRIQDPDKAIARVEAVCHDADLALLAVNDPAFSADVPTARIGDLPDLRDRVSVIGFPVGGEEVSITEGVVSRVEVQHYTHSERQLLAATVDAAINAGNSGGPVFKDGDVVGIAFQKLPDADNIGELVPAPLIRRFLDGVDQGKSPVVPGLGVTTQSLENPALRRHVGLSGRETGLLVVSTDYGGSAYGRLRPGDALLAIEGHRISNNGTVQYLGRYRTRYDVVVNHRFVGDEIELEVLRDGQRISVTVELAPMVHLVPRSQYDVVPTYFIYGGCVFQPLTRNFLATWDTWWDKAPKEFLHDYYSGARTPERQEVVVLSQVLADEVNVGYDELYSESVVAVGDWQPRDMREFVDMVESCDGEVRIRTSSDALIVLDRETARAGNDRILSRYRIVADRSADLRKPSLQRDPS